MAAIYSPGSESAERYLFYFDSWHSSAAWSAGFSWNSILRCCLFCEAPQSCAQCSVPFSRQSFALLIGSANAVAPHMQRIRVVQMTGQSGTIRQKNVGRMARGDG